MQYLNYRNKEKSIHAEKTTPILPIHPHLSASIQLDFNQIMIKRYT